MKKYSVCFIFTPDFEKVLLIHKLKPEWQKGLINGIGGKLEENETMLTCSSREVKEETDLIIEEEQWVYIANLTSNIFFTEVFAATYHGDISDAKTMETEQIEWFATKHLPENMMNNLYWLIPLAIDKLKHKEPKLVKVTY